MLYFMGLNKSSASWTGNFTAAVITELSRRKIEHKRLPPVDWQTTTLQAQIYRDIRSNPKDVWLIGWAQSPAIELIQDKPGKKFGMVVGLAAMPFEPAVLQDTAQTLREPERLFMYDHIFANSDWCRRCLLKHYPGLRGKVTVTGFPIDFEIYSPYRTRERNQDLVVFNQRFSLEKLHVLEIELARLLSEQGYRVHHLTGVNPSTMAKSSNCTAELMHRAKLAGLDFIYNETKHQYHSRLAKAAVVITTSAADMLPSSLIEAVYLGAVPVAPDHRCFGEFIHPDNLYTPYDMDEILSLVRKRPYRNHDIMQYRAADVVDRFLCVMGIETNK